MSQYAVCSPSRPLCSSNLASNRRPGVACRGINGGIFRCLTLEFCQTIIRNCGVALDDISRLACKPFFTKSFSEAKVAYRTMYPIGTMDPWQHYLLHGRFEGKIWPVTLSFTCESNPLVGRSWLRTGKNKLSRCECGCQKVIPLFFSSPEFMRY